MGLLIPDEKGLEFLSRNFVLPFELPKAFAPTNLHNTIMYLTFWGENCN